MTNALEERLAAVRATVENACAAAGRDASEVHTIVVTKNHPAQLVRELAALGVREVGENRDQEAAPKAEALDDLDLHWHFVGQLQSNKVNKVLRYASTIHSVDRASLVQALARAGQRVDCFIQVNLTQDAARGGVAPNELECLAEKVLNVDNLNLLGLMAVAPLDEEPAAAFERLAEYSTRLQHMHGDAHYISAGMSHDFEQALQYGATHLRIGSAITGVRPNTR